MTDIATGPHPPSIVETLQGIAGSINHRSAGLTTGDIAALRRMDPRRIDGAGFWKIEAVFLEPHLAADAEARSRQETEWAAVLVGLARLGELHTRSARLGDALRESALSESRFVRLMRADRDALIDELPALARFLAAKGQRADWTSAAKLLLLSETQGEQQRRHIARDYYRE